MTNKYCVIREAGYNENDLQLHRPMSSLSIGIVSVKVKALMIKSYFEIRYCLVKINEIQTNLVFIEADVKGSTLDLYAVYSRATYNLGTRK